MGESRHLKKQPEFAELLGSSVYSPAFYEKNKGVIIENFGDMTDADYHRFVTFVRAIMKFDIRADLSKIKATVLAFGACDEAPDFLDRLWNFFENDETN